MTEDYNDGKIHGWNGGECPVHPETLVRAWFRDGAADHLKGKSLRWTHKDQGGDIIAFQVVKQHHKPKVIWVNEYRDGYHTAHDTKERAIASASKLPFGLLRIAVKYQEVPL